MWNIQIAETSLVISTNDLLTIEQFLTRKTFRKVALQSSASNFSAHNDDRRSKPSSLMGYDGYPP